MTGKTHFRIGILAYGAMVSIKQLYPLSLNTSALNIPNEISITALLIAGVSAYLPDIDTYKSKINHLNKPLAYGEQRITYIGHRIRRINDWLFTVIISLLIWLQLPKILALIKPIKASYHPYITGSIIVLIVWIGLVNARLLMKIPLMGRLYRNVDSFLLKWINRVRKGFFILIYSGLGMGIIIYNLIFVHEPIYYLAGAIFIMMSVTPHRSFTHSILEGGLIISYTTIHVMNLAGLKSYVAAVIIGYSSHLFLADNLTKEGVPLFYVLPRLVEHFKIPQVLSTSRFFPMVYKLLKMRMRIPLMATGSRWGHIFEEAYVIIGFIITILLWTKGHQGEIINLLHSLGFSA